MKVVARKIGYFGGLIRDVGTVFEVHDDAAASWFEPVEPKQVEPENDLTVKELKQALDELGVDYPANANKETLSNLLAEHQG